MKALGRFAFAVLVASLLGSSFVSAGVPEGLHYMVSPISCQPENSASATLLQLVNGAWTFKANPGVTAQEATLVCPVSFYGNEGQFNNLQLWYKADTQDPYNLVRAEFRRRDRQQAGDLTLFSVSTEDNNATDNGYGYVDNTNVFGGPTTGHNYYVRVLLFRNTYHNPNNVAFVGFAIDIQ